MIRVMFFCLGNICRSPLGEALFEHHVQQRRLDEQFEIQSSGTSSYHVGEQPDPGSQRVAMRRAGIDLSHQRSQQLTSTHLADFDHVVAMSEANLLAAKRLSGSAQANFLLLRDFEPDDALQGLDTPDPWGRGDDAFEEVFEIVSRCTLTLLDHLIELHNVR